MDTPAVHIVAHGDAFVAIAGIRLRSILSAELFREVAGISAGASGTEIAARCHERWVELANTLAALPRSAEVLAFFGELPLAPPRSAGARPDVVSAFCALGHGATAASAEERCLRACRDVWTPLVTTLDYAELQPIREGEAIAAIVAAIERGRIVEIRRRHERLQLAHGAIVRRPLGFGVAEADADAEAAAPDVAPAAERAGDGGGVWQPHLFPWVPSDDPWRRLVEALVAEDGPAAVVVRLRGFDPAPEACRSEARAALAAAEKTAALRVDGRQRVDEVLRRQAEQLRDAALWRLAILEGRVLAGRLFLVSSDPASAGLVATVEASVDDASVRPGQTGTESMFRGGAARAEVDAGAVLAPLTAPRLDLLFGPLEASAIVRTPMPTDFELPGLRVSRARTAPLLGVPGDDVPLGVNVHRGQRVPVAMEPSARFRHTYVVGQTGTGKSTLLLHMALADIRAGRGVAVLDPHGSLVDDILLRLPPERADDVVIVDVTDSERPVGFNVLRIETEDTHAYRHARDLVIDDLYAFLDRTYDLKQTGGPIFESHFRGMLALLLGSEPPVAPRVPNLMVFRALYTNRRLRRRLARTEKGRDLVLDDFIDEALRAGGDLSIENVAPYITSKFNRFVSDHALRNITCQREALDLDAIVNEGRILLFHLGKGRFGDQAAGLLASQIVSRIRHVVMRRGADGRARPFYLYADEFQLFADDRFAELLAEARKFGLALTLAHQFVEQLPERTLQAILGNVGTIAAYRVGPRDGERLDTMFWPTFRRRDLCSLPNFSACVRSFGSLGLTPFSVEVPPKPPEGDPAAAAAVRERARYRYGRPRSLVEAEIAETYEAYKTAEADDE